MRTMSLSIVLLVGFAAPAQGGPLGFGGLGRHHGGFGWGHGGLGLWGFYDTEFAQSRIEDKLDDLMTEYDDGLAEIEDYYNSDDYDDVVNDTEWLSDRYDLFLVGVENKIDWLGSSITHLTDECETLDELLTKYESDEDLSAERLERLTNWITHIQDFLTLKVDYLSEKQTTLSENLTTYTAFDEEIATFLDTIVAAGEGSSEAAETETTATESTISDSIVSAIAATAMTSAVALTGTIEESLPPVVEAPLLAAVPEPTCLALVALALLTLGPRQLRRLSHRMA